MVALALSPNASEKAFGPDEEGAMLVETAVVLPLFLLMLLGLFNFAMVVSGFNIATYAACDGARYAALHSSTSLDPATTTSVQSYVTQFVHNASATVAVAYTGGNVVGGTVKITVTIAYPLTIPFYGVSHVSVGSTAQQTITR